MPDWTIDSGVLIMEHGRVTAFGDEQRTARRPEDMTYRIAQKNRGIQTHAQGGREWAHFVYVFTYKRMNQTVHVTWRCGTGYGKPKPEDGLTSLFEDARTIEGEAFSSDWARNLGYESIDDYEAAKEAYDACVKASADLRRLFSDGDDVRQRWADALLDR